MNDTNKKILVLFNLTGELSSSKVHGRLSDDISLVTIKRRLVELTELGYLETLGGGRSVTYRLSKMGRLLRHFDVKKYLSEQPDLRSTNTSFQFDIVEEPYISLLSPDEVHLLDDSTSLYRNNARSSSAALRNKELLRFIVEFSWKTSRIEGNTYDLLSTERLLQYGEKSSTNTEYETQMIINQKEALELILGNTQLWARPTIGLLEELQRIVVKNLDIPASLRKSLVGITGTNYRPLDNQFQIKEAIEKLFTYIQLAPNIYERSLLAVLGISYIQPFVDGNKRTARLIGNAILLSANCAPLSYRSVDEQAYKEATLLFYEQNSIEAFKGLFIEQYAFAAKNYNVAN